MTSKSSVYFERYIYTALYDQRGLSRHHYRLEHLNETSYKV